MGLITRTFDALVGGGLGELASVRLAGASQKANGIFFSGLLAGAHPALIASGGTYFVGRDVSDDVGKIGAAVAGNYVRDLTRVHVGSL
ncbi:hypothetical protein [Cryobacterium zhongshanensis]|uniref:Uncharacterized protein n=1 Tax=Cryobacterium zhongshanensis TaxID=2928153 RepID=A0AA41QUX6_9MICO|nr:hypothetical protein [Cryobacterium zhongshanensis]MCI4658210.1 hypothetical protein [Cryobacterium zhongshanensis]